MKRLLTVAGLPFLAVVLNVGCDRSSGLPKPANLSYLAIEDGERLQLDWDAVKDAIGYRLTVDDTTYETTATSDTVETPAETIAVTAYNSEFESDAVEIICSPVVTASIEVYGISDPDHPSGFGFIGDGTAHAFALSDSSNWPSIDYVMDDFDGVMNFRSPNSFLPPYNGEDNTVAEAVGTGFDDARNAEGDFRHVLEAKRDSVYYLRIDPNANGWDAGADHFAKAKVESVVDEKVTLKLAFQTIPGLSWLVTD
jgi:hypothetical protein